jgi:endonuclease/exonuclease/phosphatase family metal-dependent hydrolase
MELKILNLNLKNKHYLFPYDGIDKDVDAVQILVNYIIKNKIDIISLQEVTKPLVDRLEVMLSDYSVKGDYRYSRLGFIAKLDNIEKYDEANPIIHKHKTLKYKTYFLPSINFCIRDVLKYRFVPPAQRIMTYNRIKVEGMDKSIDFYNTHLDIKSDRIRKKQFRKILNITNIFRKRNPVVITGDFNVPPDNKGVVTFLEKLKKKKMKLVEFNSKTWKYQQKNKPVDYIIIPDSWEIIEKKIINNESEPLTLISDHYAIEVTVRTK